MTKSPKIKKTKKISSKKIKKNNIQDRILHAFIEACFLNHTFYYKIRLEDIEVKIEKDAFLYFEYILTYVLSEIIESAWKNTTNVIETKNIIESIKAVFNAFETDEIYFVADGKGGHYFSKTLEEHNAYIKNIKKLNE